MTVDNVTEVLLYLSTAVTVTTVQLSQVLPRGYVSVLASEALAASQYLSDTNRGHALERFARTSNVGVALQACDLQLT